MIDKPVGAVIHLADGSMRVVRDSVRQRAPKPRHWTEALARALNAAASTAHLNSATLEQGRQIIWHRTMQRILRRNEA